MINKSKILVGVFVASALFSGASFASAETKISVTSKTESVIKVGTKNVVTWETQNFPEGAFININLVKKVSDNPAKYELVRQIASYTVNDGEEAWVAEKDDVGENVFIEVTCGGSTRFKSGCVSGQSEDTFAVETSFGRNLASAISSFFEGFLGIFVK